MADLRPADDQSISDAELLYLRVFPSPDVIITNDNGERRPMTGGIKGRDKDEPLSVDLGSLSSPDRTRMRGPGGNFHVVAVSAGVVRVLGLRVSREPIEGAHPNPAHALIHGTKENPISGDLEGGLTKGEYGSLARNFRVVLDAPNP